MSKKKFSEPKKGMKGYPWRIAYYKWDELITIATANEISDMVGRARSTVRKYAADRKRFRDGTYFEYEPEYYEQEHGYKRGEKTETIPMYRGKTLQQMAREAKRRHISYGQLQVEEYCKKQKKIVVPEGYTSMRDRGK